MNAALELIPSDEHNRRLLQLVHPTDWVNPKPAARYNLVVVGGGTAGLVSAMGAAGLGARVALVERHLLGGDCLNTGCVPSKALLSAAHAAHASREAKRFGVHVAEIHVNFGQVMERLRAIRADIAPHDSAQRIAEVGVDLFLGEGHYVASDALEVDGRRLRFSRSIIATGGRAAPPPIPGLEEAGYLTNETVFSLTERPKHLLVIGGGPIGCEMAQAFRRLGSAVTVLEMAPRLLTNDDPEAGALLARCFAAEGIQVVTAARVVRAEVTASGKRIHYEVADGPRDAEGDAVLVAVGRAVNVGGLGLEAAGVEYDGRGVHVDDRLRTTNRRIFAAGDVCAGLKLTHAADAMARIALQNALFWGRKRNSALNIPWCTYTDPEVAHVGIGAEAARARGLGELAAELSDNDRAVTEGRTQGFARAFHDRKGRLLGATIVAPNAGDMIGELTLAMNAKLGLGDLGATIHPYPTRAAVIKQLGDAYARTRLTPRVRGSFTRMFAWRR